MRSFAYYDADGRIVFTAVVDETEQPSVAGLSRIEAHADPQTDYVDGESVKPRPSMTPTLDTNTVPADGATAATLTGLPDPVDVQITGPVADAFECDGGTLELTFTVPGTYTVHLSKFPYLDAEEVISAT